MWLDENYAPVPPKSNLGQAMQYSINNYGILSNYLLDGRLTIDNNLSEHCMKNFVIERKNFLFCFTESGTEDSGVAYNIVETAPANNLNVYECLKYVFDMIPHIDIHDANALRSLLPYSTSLPSFIKVKNKKWNKIHFLVLFNLLLQYMRAFLRLLFDAYILNAFFLYNLS